MLTEEQKKLLDHYISWVAPQHDARLISIGRELVRPALERAVFWLYAYAENAAGATESTVEFGKDNVLARLSDLIRDLREADPTGIEEELQAARNSSSSLLSDDDVWGSMIRLLADCFVMFERVDQSVLHARLMKAEFEAVPDMQRRIEEFLTSRSQMNPIDNYLTFGVAVSEKSLDFTDVTLRQARLDSRRRLLAIGGEVIYPAILRAVALRAQHGQPVIDQLGHLVVDVEKSDPSGVEQSLAAASDDADSDVRHLARAFGQLS